MSATYHYLFISDCDIYLFLKLTEDNCEMCDVSAFLQNPVL